MAKRRKRVLFVDDEPDLVLMLATALEPYDIETHTAHNGKEAFNLLMQVRFDVVVTDIFMPEMNGIEFLRKVKRFAVDTDILCLSGGGSINGVSIKEDVKKLGCSGFFEKPAGIRAMIAKVVELCSDESVAS